jgi:hypothetical protein
MKNLLLALFFVSLALSASQRAVSQDHAPTVEQCRADRNLWSSQMRDYLQAEGDRMKSGTPNHTEIMKLKLSQLLVRFTEMLHCEAVDPSEASEYYSVVEQLELAHEDRYMLFVQRHKLEAQLFQEDDAGLR